ncbi:MAG: CYCXC family (seleno)protein [Thermodesulfobacteriota bacterium]
MLVLAFLAVLTLASCSQESSGRVDAASMRGGETRPTLSPANFYAETATAYEVAREMPEVLDSLYCYCDCKKHMNHKSLLTCYTNEHAAYCDICINEALMAKRLHEQGKDVLAIRKAVDEKFSRIRQQRM